MTFVTVLKDEVGYEAGYEALCQEAEGDAGKLGAHTLGALLSILNPLISSCPPGHDRNHIYRDMLGALALVAADPFIGKARYAADVFAGILGASFHDIGNGLTRRYEDTERRAGHAEIGAWLFNEAAKDLNEAGGVEIVPEPVRMLAAYAIAAHTHYTKPIPVKNPVGYERQPYWYRLWGEVGRPVGLAVFITRFADRLDTNGVTLFARHLVATADAVEAGGGKDYTGKDFFELNEAALGALFLPEVREGKPKPPTVLEHMNMFADSNLGASIYSRDDHLFPTMNELMMMKVEQTHRLTDIVTGDPPEPEDFSAFGARFRVQNTLRMISGSPKFDRSWEVLRLAWDALDESVQARWYAGFAYVRKAYRAWVSTLVDHASFDEEYAALAANLAQLCL
jgi:hypothetical protein